VKDRRQMSSLINSTVHHNTHSYKVTSISDRSFQFCANRQTHRHTDTDRRRLKTIPASLQSLTRVDKYYTKLHLFIFARTVSNLSLFE